jgi:hypothetical protein
LTDKIKYSIISLTNEREVDKMTAIELERKIEDMRIQFAKENAKENWNGNTDDISREDWLSIYSLMRTKEYYDECKKRGQIK